MKLIQKAEYNKEQNSSPPPRPCGESKFFPALRLVQEAHTHAQLTLPTSTGSTGVRALNSSLYL